MSQRKEKNNFLVMIHFTFTSIEELHQENRKLRWMVSNFLHHATGIRRANHRYRRKSKMSGSFQDVPMCCQIELFCKPEEWCSMSKPIVSAIAPREVSSRMTSKRWILRFIQDFGGKLVYLLTDRSALFGSFRSLH
jgi:hypothetical protein